jgi:hypothetical protein
MHIRGVEDQWGLGGKLGQFCFGEGFLQFTHGGGLRCWRIGSFSLRLEVGRELMWGGGISDVD